MRGAIPPLPQYVFMAWCLKHRDNFTFTFTFIRLLNVNAFDSVLTDSFYISRDG
jgi:hypothetical protein